MQVRRLRTAADSSTRASTRAWAWGPQSSSAMMPATLGYMVAEESTAGRAGTTRWRTSAEVRERWMRAMRAMTEATVERLGPGRSLRAKGGSGGGGVGGG